MRFFLRLIATMAGLWVATALVPSVNIVEGTSLMGSILVLAGIALVLTLVNSLVKPIIKVLTFPLYVLTFGLFAVVTNALCFMLTGWLSSSIGLPFEVGGFWAAVFGALITAVVSSLVLGLIGDESENK